MGPFGGFRSAADFGGRTPANCIRQRATCGLSRCCDVTRWVAVRPDRSRALRHSCDQEMKAYFVLDITVQDYKRFKTYIDEIPKIIERRRGKSIVQGAEPVVLEEERGHQRLVVIEFRSPLFLNPTRHLTDAWCTSAKGQSGGPHDMSLGSAYLLKADIRGL
jgi:uncharacterized protein (DUF1330 family)